VEQVLFSEHDLTDRKNKNGDVARVGLLRISRSHFRDLIAAGAFPPPLKIGRASRWSRSQVEEFLAKINKGPL